MSTSATVETGSHDRAQLMPRSASAIRQLMEMTRVEPRKCAIRSVNRFCCAKYASKALSSCRIANVVQSGYARAR